MEKYCISISELAKRMGISQPTAYKLANSNGFYPAFRVGNRLLINVNSLEKWLAEQTA